MIGRLKPYPSYKNSGVKWFGRTPAHWEIHRLKHVASVQPSNVDKKTEDGESPVRLCNYVDVYYNERITAALDFMRATATEDEKRKFQLRVGDVCVTKDSEEWSDIAVPACVADEVPDLLCGYHLALVRPRPGRTHGEFLARAFAARGVNDQFRVEANGITRFALGQGALACGLFPVPPVDEQQAIASFLDRETDKIDALVKKKERLIELLQEKRTALISHAVTQGLDPTVPKKDSGVPWLGKIPKHWEIKPLKIFFDFGKGSNAQELTAEYISDHAGEYPVYSGQTENDGVMGRISSYAYDVPEVIFTTTVGARVMTPLVLQGRFSLSQNCLIMRPRNGGVCVRYIFYQLHPLFCYERAAIPSYMQPSLRMSDLNHYSMVCPPTDEQKTIAEHLDRETAKMDALMAKVHMAIERLQEYRTALISAAVTGQIDVRPHSRE